MSPLVTGFKCAVCRDALWRWRRAARRPLALHKLVVLGDAEGAPRRQAICQAPLEASRD